MPNICNVLKNCSFGASILQADNSADGKPSVSAALSSSGHLPSAVLGNFKAGLIQSVTAPNLGDIFECDVFELTSTTKDFMTVEGQVRCFLSPFDSFHCYCCVLLVQFGSSGC